MTAHTLRRLELETASLLMYARSGGLRLIPPGRIAAVLRALDRYGLMGAATVIAAARDRDGLALIDERGPTTFGELDARTNALANEWRRLGLGPGASVAILTGNHRGFLDAVYAAAKCGAEILLLNTGFGPTQLAEMLAREGADLLVYDDEYAAAVAEVRPRLGRFRAWADAPGTDTLDTLIERGDPGPPPRSGGRPKIVISTSGTTGVPKGALRSEPYSLIPVGGLLGKVPFRGREVTECCVPLFHSMGFSHAMYAMVLGSTLVLHRHFDAEQALDSVAAHRASAMIVVPVMLRRILDLGWAALAERDLSSLRIVFVGGSQLGAALATRALRDLGPVVYNMYGSTEVAYATIATPADLAVAPGCVGAVVPGSVVKVFAADGREVPAGTPGRIFVGNVLAFEGYTGGGTKESIRGLMATGDVGHFDAAGRLFIDGRDDEMIVSGGENVYPGEVEEALVQHPGILDAAVLGVSDEEFGQRLRAYVVARPDASLTERDVKEYIRNRLARFKVPRDVVFVDALPRNAGGKVLKRLLPV
ncbi:AMP-binding protein [Mycobacterium terramassiliense]|uniref:Long-chain-fatty-acid--CoA ligase FadD13 n=1 Tax=Mycobacterium terramassiliense TaxID=1841859 RepID=A0A2U3NAJ3_9MYCO|nr:AMP-binding protein [Mycobacterium terramassiliense]SPM28558.1 Acyl-CoA synthetase (AMP-forming)/AMP-acid ligase II [Mycobacterium terramassiliense]